MLFGKRSCTRQSVASGRALAVVALIAAAALLCASAQSNLLTTQLVPTVVKRQISSLPRFALYSNTDGRYVPVQTLQHQIQIQNSIANITVTQSFVVQQTAQNVTYHMRIPQEHVFLNLTANFSGDAVLTSQVTAKTQFCSSDLMSFDLGVAPAWQQVRVVYSYLQVLNVSANQFWLLNLTHVPYTSAGGVSPGGTFVWSAYVNLSAPAPITFLQANIPTSASNGAFAFDAANLTATGLFSRITPIQFVLLYSNARQYEPTVDLCVNAGDTNYPYAAHVQFFPQFVAQSQTAPIQDVQFFYTEQIVRPAQQAITGEYLFVIDRSGSMDDFSKIVILRSVLSQIIQALPENSFFNIVSFGTTMQVMYGGLQQATSTNKADALLRISNFKADLGGTIMYNALQSVFSTAPAAGRTRTVFAMTDGMMNSLADETIQITQAAVFASSQRLYAIAIGSDADQDFLVRLAEAGQGQVAFVEELLDFYSTLDSFLKASYTYYVQTTTLTYDLDVVAALTPLAQAYNSVRYNEGVHLYFLFRANVTLRQQFSANLTYVNSFTGTTQTMNLVISLQNVTCQGPALHKIIARTLSAQALKSVLFKNNANQYFYYPKAITPATTEGLLLEMQALAVNYTTLTEATKITTQQRGSNTPFEGQVEMQCHLCDPPTPLSPQDYNSIALTSNGLITYQQGIYWGYVCNKAFTQQNAIVACRQLAQQNGWDINKALSNVTWSGGKQCGGGMPQVLFGEYAPMAQIYDSLACTGCEDQLALCNNWGEFNVSDNTFCQTNCIQLNCSGYTGTNDQVDIYENRLLYQSVYTSTLAQSDQFVQVCADGWTDADAKVACRQYAAQYGLDVAQFTSSYYYITGYPCFSGPMGYRPSNFDCIGNETTLGQCRFTVGQPCFNQCVMLVCGTSNSIRIRNAVAEYYYVGYWGNICSANINQNTANSICRQYYLYSGEPNYMSAVATYSSKQCQISQSWISNLNCASQFDKAIDLCAQRDLYYQSRCDVLGQNCLGLECVLTKCAAKCATCSSDQNNCFQCAGDVYSRSAPPACECLANTTVSASGNCVPKTCSLFRYFDIPTLSCKLCDASCNTCWGPSATQCIGPSQTTCQSYQYWDSTLRQCLNCSSTCQTCSGPSTCLGQTDQSCTTSEFWSIFNRACQGCHIYCRTCTGSQFYQCQSTTIINCTTTQYWDTTSRSCQACSNACLMCYGPSSSQCIDPVKPATCLSTQFYDPIAQVCAECDISCASCVGPFPQDCIELADNSTTCSTGKYYSIATRQCQQCSTNCMACNGPSSSECSKFCPLSQYFDPVTGTCQYCAPNCQSCNGSSLTQCQQLGQCASEQYYDPVTTACQSCDIACTQCTGPGLDHCTELKTCEDQQYFDRDLVQCQSCDIECLSCTGPTLGDCQETKFCGHGTYFDRTTGACEYCAATCAHCTGPQKSECTEFGVCEPGLYYDIRFDSCEECAPGCQLCYGSQLEDCMDDQQNCNEGEYFNRTMLECEACHKDCIQCTGPAALDCQIFANCSNGTYFNASTSQCEACYQNCTQCVGPNEEDCLDAKKDKPAIPYAAQIVLGVAATYAGTLSTIPLVKAVSSKIAASAVQSGAQSAATGAVNAIGQAQVLPANVFQGAAAPNAGVGVVVM